MRFTSHSRHCRRGAVMQITIEILRRENANAAPFWESFQLDADEGSTVMTALLTLNERLSAEGKRLIRFECSCLQKKCGACAMVIQGRPCLACDAILSDVQKNRVVRVEPLRKFPVISDLIVDRQILFENLKTLRIWLETDCVARGKGAELAYEASKCLQCGCCLEVCPNFCADAPFFGMAACIPTARLLSELPREERKRLCDMYREHIYEGCGKSLACRSICPAGLEIDRLLVNSNAVAIWKRK